MEKNTRIFVAGHRGLVGSAFCELLRRRGFSNVLTRPRAELDLTDQKAVRDFFEKERPECVLLAAAKVGGIHANSTYPAEFLFENLAISTNVIHAAHQTKVSRLLQIGSACMYPRLAEQPMREESLLTGSLEPTNEAYAIAKIAASKLCEFYFKEHGNMFVSVIPCNLYGPRENFHPENSHVVPGLIRRFHEAKVSKSPEVVVWGTGRAEREFLYIDDLAEALMLVLEDYDWPEPMNIGVGRGMTIRELAETVAKVTEYPGKIVFDTSKPDGQPRKLLESSRIQKMGWTPQISLEEGIARTYRWALESGVINQ
jgi:GDP-L-fucose synthase